MKELAIRIWSYSEKKWILPIPTIEGYSPISFSFPSYDNRIAYIAFDNHFLGFDDYEIVRYTGLADKHGAKIFEGDIVQGSWDEKQICKGIVEFVEGWYGVNLQEGVEWPQHWTPLDQNGWEIIGNKYEHPEILEQR